MAIVIEDALHPLQANFPIGTIGHDGCILYRDLDLVVVTVGHPAPYLLFGQLTLVHGPMVGMVNMIELALCSELGLELLPA